MLLKSLNFETWSKNHPTDHYDKWYRQLYPFDVLSRVNFSAQLIGKDQEIYFEDVLYRATIVKIDLQSNGRYKATVNLSTQIQEENLKWLRRAWATSFQVIYSIEYYFITVFTKKEDPSKEAVVNFMKGRFDKVTHTRSLPISEFLFRTLLLDIAEYNYPGGEVYSSFKYSMNGVRKLPMNDKFNNICENFQPLYALERKLWLCYSFNEEKAHRMAFYYSNQCEKLIVVYCNPTYTKHERCMYQDIDVISLFQFAKIKHQISTTKYEGQIRFLQNHLQQSDATSLEELKCEIDNPARKMYPIANNILMEALSIIKVIPENEYDFFYFLSCANLINAWLGRKRKMEQISLKDKKSLKDIYFFKTYVVNTISEWILNSKSPDIFMDKEILYITSFDFQFSFHSIPITDILTKYLKNSIKSTSTWKGKRLQPIAPLLVDYARMLRSQNLK
jgi:hypothetical protein